MFVTQNPQGRVLGRTGIVGRKDKGWHDRFGGKGLAEGGGCLNLLL